MIAGVLTVKNDGDIVGHTMRHLLAEGIDRIYVVDGMSTDGTREVIEDVRRHDPSVVVLFDDDSPIHYQARWVNGLAAHAAADGATWIVPFDADEFWIATDHRSTLAECLRRVPATVDRSYAWSFPHHSWEQREVYAHPWPKVAYRWAGAADIAYGNHDVAGLKGDPLHGELQIREIQYRGFEHFCAKAAARNATIDPSLPLTRGAHHRYLAGMTREQMQHEWAVKMARPTLLDPIPTRANIEPLRW